MLFQNRYEYDPKTDLIANGSAARIYKARDRQGGRYVALKFYHTLGIDAERFKGNMKKALQLQEHPLLVRLLDYFEVENVNHFGEVQYLRIGVWEYVPPTNGPGFAERAKSHPTETLGDLLDALQYLHDNECRHFDLQEKNILMAEGGKVKVNNYQIFDDGSYKGDWAAALTPAMKHRAPEYFLPGEYGMEDGGGANHDLWSFGCMLHNICLGSLPFGIGDSEVSTAGELRHRLDSQRELQLPDGMGEPFATLIEKCLVRHAAYRVKSPAELKEIMRVTSRKYRFDAVLPLSREQLLSRYSFGADDRLDAIEAVRSFEVFDNLAGRPVKLQIFAPNPDVAFFDAAGQSGNHYFTVRLPGPNGDLRTHLVGLQPGSVQLGQPQPAGKAVAQGETEPPGFAADDATPSSGFALHESKETPPPAVAAEFVPKTPSLSNLVPEVEKPEQTVPPPASEKLKATEVIRREALERVRRDMEQLRSDKNKD